MTVKLSNSNFANVLFSFCPSATSHLQDYTHMHLQKKTTKQPRGAQRISRLSQLLLLGYGSIFNQAHYLLEHAAVLNDVYVLYTDTSGVTHTS